MVDHGKVLALSTGLAAILVASPLRAQSATPEIDTDPRWNAWLGCWTADTTRTGAPAVSASSAICVIPIEGSRAVDALTIARGEVVSRERLDASGRPHSVNGNGCRGTETVNWSESARRVYVHSDYTCSGGQPGTSTSLYAITSSGLWLRVEKVRAGSGAVTSFTQLRPTSPSPALASSTIRAIERRQRLIATARAAAAAAISANEIVDAVNNLDGDVVRAWIVASDQTWNLDATQLAVLVNAGVPSPILAIVSPRGATQIDVTIAPTVTPLPAVVVDEEPVVMTTMRVCPPVACVSRYSPYNGVGYDPLMAYPPYPYPYSPFGFVPFSSVVVSTPVVTRDGKGRGRQHAGSRPGSRGHDGPPGKWSGGRGGGGPIGRPIGRTAGGRGGGGRGR